MIQWKKIEANTEFTDDQYMIGEKVGGHWLLTIGEWDELDQLWNTEYEGDIEPTHYAAINYPEE